jgi:hypothetical protein
MGDIVTALDIRIIALILAVAMLAARLSRPAFRRPRCGGWPWCAALLYERYKIVLADSLKNEESCRAGPTIADQVWAARSHRIGLTWVEPYLLFGFTQEEADAPIDHIKRVLDITVAVPRHLLGRRDLEFGDTETAALEMMS